MSDARRDGAIDLAIDEVARQMTDGQPPPDFRARIVARLDAGERPRRFWPAPWVLSPIAVAAAIVLAILVARPFKGRDRAPAAADQTVRLPPLPQSGFGGTGRQDTATVRLKPDAAALRLKRDAAYERQAAGIRRPERIGPGAAEIDALAPPRLDVAPLDVEALPTESIAVPQLDAIAPITVAPLPEIEQRPATNDPRP